MMTSRFAQKAAAALIESRVENIRSTAQAAGRVAKAGLVITLALILAGCSVPVAITEALPTPRPTPTHTPEVAPPSLPSGLRPENAAAQVFENGTWVVKNPAGEVTATWDAATLQWIYHMETILVSRSIIGFGGQDESILDPLLVPLPADTPENHFIDPETNQPIPYGYYGENIHQMSSVPLAKIVDYTNAVFLTRNLGVVQVDDDLYAYVHELPVSVDHSIVLIQPGIVMRNGIGVGPAYFDDPTDVMGTILNLKGDFFPIEQRHQFVQDFRGRQVVILINHAVSQEICEVHNSLCQAGAYGDLTLQYIQDPTASPPEIPFPTRDAYGFFSGANWIEIYIGVPESAIMESPYFK